MPRKRRRRSARRKKISSLGSEEERSLEIFRRLPSQLPQLLVSLITEYEETLRVVVCGFQKPNDFPSVWECDLERKTWKFGGRPEGTGMDDNLSFEDEPSRWYDFSSANWSVWTLAGEVQLRKTSFYNAYIWVSDSFLLWLPISLISGINKWDYVTGERTTVGLFPDWETRAVLSEAVSATQLFFVTMGALDDFQIEILNLSTNQWRTWRDETLQKLAPMGRLSVIGNFLLLWLFPHSHTLGLLKLVHGDIPHTAKWLVRSTPKWNLTPDISKPEDCFAPIGENVLLFKDWKLWHFSPTRNQWTEIPLPCLFAPRGINVGKLGSPVANFLLRKRGKGRE